MDLNTRVDVNCGRKDGRTDGRTENRTPISHLGKAGATKKKKRKSVNIDVQFDIVWVDACIVFSVGMIVSVELTYCL